MCKYREALKKQTAAASWQIFPKNARKKKHPLLTSAENEAKIRAR